MRAIDELEKTLLGLPVEQRTILAEALLCSLPSTEVEWSDSAELREVERRQRELDSGQAQALSESEFWERLEANRNR